MSDEAIFEGDAGHRAKKLPKYGEKLIFSGQNGRDLNSYEQTKMMIIREAKIDDIKEMQIIRNAVTENTLSNPNLVTDEDCAEFMTARGKGWVCEIDQQIVGFAIADLKENNIWALFLHPEFERKGIGQKLHKTMLDWYFTQTKDTVWLGTAFDTRAEKFYRKAGWTEIGTHGTKEIKFEMTYDNWTSSRHL